MIFFFLETIQISFILSIFLKFYYSKEILTK